jgi:hypothetical protein
MTKEKMPKPLRDFLAQHWPDAPIRPLYGPDGASARTWLVPSTASPSSQVMDDLADLADAHLATILFF